MKKCLFSFLLFFLFLGSVSAKQKLYVFHRYDCPHCRSERTYLETIKEDYPEVDFVYLEVVRNKENLNHLENVKKTLKDENNYVPYTVIGKYTLVGFNEATKEQIKSRIVYCIENNCEDVVGKVIEEGRTLSLEEKKDFLEEKLSFPLLGNVDVKKVSLPLLSIILGFLDGFNPCAMWVLLFLISMLLGMKNRKRMWILGVCFLLTSALLYTLFLVAWLKLEMAFKNILLLRNSIAIFALFTGILHFKKYVQERKKKGGCTVTNEKQRKTIRNKIKQFTNEKNFVLALLGVMALAISVNMIELSCSAGIPLVYTQILSLQNLSIFQYGLSIFIYILFYLIDDIVLFVLAMTSLKVIGITNRYNKYSHLLGGTLLLLIGLLLLLKPDWLLFSF